jgi:hypothetical protein
MFIALRNNVVSGRWVQLDSFDAAATATGIRRSMMMAISVPYFTCILLVIDTLEDEFVGSTFCQRRRWFFAVTCLLCTHCLWHNCIRFILYSLFGNKFILSTSKHGDWLCRIWWIQR